MTKKSDRTGTGPGGDVISELAAKVRETRELHRLTQAELAGLSGTGRRFVSDLESGKRTVALDKVVAVLATLGLRLTVETGAP